MLAVLITFAFAFGMAGVGTALVRRLVAGLDPAAVFGIGGMVGLGVAGWLTLFIGLCPDGLIWGVWVVVAVACAGAWLQYTAKAWRTLRVARPKDLEWAWVAGLAVPSLLALVGVLAPSDSLDWDSLSYHLAVPKLWLQAGRIEYIPFIHHSNFPFVVDNLYIWGLTWGGEQGAKAFSLAFLLFGLCAVFGLGRQLYGRVAGMWASLAFATIPVVMWESGTGYIDVAHGLFAGLGAALVAMGVTKAWSAKSDKSDLSVAPKPSMSSKPATPHNPANLDNPDDPRSSDWPLPGWVLLGAVLLGFAVGSKYTGLQALAAVAATVFVAGALSRRPAGGLKTAATVALVAVAIGCPWYVKNAVVTGNPVFPFFYERFGGRNWDQRRADIYRREQDSFGVGRTERGLDASQVGHAILGLAYQPGRYINPGQQQGQGFPQGALGAAIFCGALAWMFSGRGRRVEGTLLGFVGISFLMWFALSQQSRYVVNLAPPLCLLLGGAVARLGAGPVVAAIAVLQAAYSVVLVRSAVTDHQLPVVVGKVSRDAYLQQKVQFYAAAQVIDDLAKDGKVALYDETFGFLLDVPYFWANPGHCTIIPYDSLSDGRAYAAEMKREGFTHIYVNFWGTWDPQDEDRWLQAAGLEGPVRPYSPDERKRITDNWETKWRVLLAEAVAAGAIRLPAIEPSGSGEPRALLFDVPR